MKYSNKILGALLLVLSAAGLLHAQTPGQGSIAVEHPWARATPGGAKTGATYMILTNSSGSADRLLRATTPVATSVQFHKVTEENGVSRMRELPTIDVAPGAKIVLKPGDMHVMLVGLKQPLKEGQTFPLTLEFEKSGKVELVVSVARVGAMEHDMSKTHH